MKETEKRSMTFVEQGSTPLVLADGQAWFLRRPKVGYKPVVVDGKVSVKPIAQAQGTEYADLLERYYFAPSNDVQWASFIFGMAALLIWPNYDLTDDELSELLTYYPDDEASQKWFTALRLHVVGQGGPPEKKP